MNVDPTLLAQALAWLVSGGGAGVAAYFLMEKVKLLAALESEAKRYVAIGLSAAIAMLAFTAAVFLSYYPQPQTVQAWLEALFAVAFVGVGLSQTIHGRVKLRH